MSRAAIITALRAKVADPSVTEAERLSAQKMLDKLIAKHGEPKQPVYESSPSTNDPYPIDPTLGPDEVYMIKIKKHATLHPDYKTKIVNPLKTWGDDKIHKDPTDGTLFFATKRPKLAQAANHIMVKLAAQQYIEEQARHQQRKSPDLKAKKREKKEEPRQWTNMEIIKSVILGMFVGMAIVIVFGG